jgi:hypothetical protein
MKIECTAAVLLLCATATFAQDAPASNWSFNGRLEIRANYRQSQEEKFQLRFPFPSFFLPVGQKAGFEETPESGSHPELSVLQLRLDAKYGKWLTAHAQVHALDKYRRNPTTSDRKVDADELWIRIGDKPEFLARPEHTSFFVQVGKAPKMERQPIRLLESYGLAATSFNRMEDTQLLLGGSVGRNLYWRFQLANGNPLFFRDPNALAGDNGVPERNPVVHPNPPEPPVKTGFPILYNAETESLFFETEHAQVGEGLGYRWQNAAETMGFDAIVFHYRRTMAEKAELTGTFYGGDILLLRGPINAGVPFHGRTKEEYGGRIYSEWHELTAIAQFTKQAVAGLQRQGYEFEAGYKFNTQFGPHVGTETLLQSIQPALRISGITNRFRGSALLYPAPSIWWPWTKIDAGVRIGFTKSTDLTIEHAKHNIGAPRKLDVDETLVTLRIRI